MAPPKQAGASQSRRVAQAISRRNLAHCVWPVREIVWMTQSREAAETLSLTSHSLLAPQHSGDQTTGAYRTTSSDSVNRPTAWETRFAPGQQRGQVSGRGFSRASTMGLRARREEALPFRRARSVIVLLWAESVVVSTGSETHRTFRRARRPIVLFDGLGGPSYYSRNPQAACSQSG